VILDIVASAAGCATQVETVRGRTRRDSHSADCGGGVRSVADARQLLSAGADKISVNTAAVQRPALLGELAQAFGCQCIVLAIDARRIGGDERWEVLGVAAATRRCMTRSRGHAKANASVPVRSS